METSPWVILSTWRVSCEISCPGILFCLACSAVLKVTNVNHVFLFSLLVGILLSVSGPNFASSALMSFLEVERSRFLIRILPGSRAVLVLAFMVPWWLLLGVPSVVASHWMPTS